MKKPSSIFSTLFMLSILVCSCTKSNKQTEQTPVTTNPGFNGYGYGVQKTVKSAYRLTVGTTGYPAFFSPDFNDYRNLPHISTTVSTLPEYVTYHSDTNTISVPMCIPGGVETFSVIHLLGAIDNPIELTAEHTVYSISDVNHNGVTDGDDNAYIHSLFGTQYPYPFGDGDLDGDGDVDTSDYALFLAAFATCM